MKCFELCEMYITFKYSLHFQVNCCIKLFFGNVTILHVKLFLHCTRNATIQFNITVNIRYIKPFSLVSIFPSIISTLICVILQTVYVCGMCMRVCVLKFNIFISLVYFIRVSSISTILHHHNHLFTFFEQLSFFFLGV